MLSSRCARRRRGKDLEEIRLHYLLPTGAQQGQGPIKVEQGMADTSTPEIKGLQDLNDYADRLKGSIGRFRGCRVAPQGCLCNCPDGLRSV